MKFFLSLFSRWPAALVLMVAVVLDFGCKHPETSHRIVTSGNDGVGAVSSGKCLRIVNGMATSAFPATVLLLHDGQQPDPCTGVFVGSNTLLTSAHCIDPTNRTNIFYAQGVQELYRDKPVTAQVSSAVHPQKVITPSGAPVGDKGPYPLASLPVQVSKDLAVLIFATSVAPAVTPIAAAGVSLSGVQVTLVGFGATKSDQDNSKLEKRTGSNKIATLPAVPNLSWNGHIALIGAAAAGSATGARADVGDSGGPLLINDQVAGIFSHIYYAADLAAQNAALSDYLKGQVLDSYADLNSAEAQTLLQTAQKEGAVLDASGSATPNGCQP